MEGCLQGKVVGQSHTLKNARQYLTFGFFKFLICHFSVLIFTLISLKFFLQECFLGKKIYLAYFKSSLEYKPQLHLFKNLFYPGFCCVGAHESGAAIIGIHRIFVKGRAAVPSQYIFVVFYVISYYFKNLGRRGDTILSCTCL